MNDEYDYKIPNKEKLFKTFQVTKLFRTHQAKKVDEIIGLKKREKKLLTLKTKKMLIEAAKEAYRLDKNMSLTEYYQLFLARLRKRYKERS